MKTLKPGDILMFTQKNGNQVMVVVKDVGIQLKADDIDTELEITRHNSFCATAMAVNKINREAVIAAIRIEVPSLSAVQYSNILFEFNLTSYSEDNLCPLNLNRLESLLSKIRDGG